LQRVPTVPLLKEVLVVARLCRALIPLMPDA
jgi:hypothetical protein